MIGLIIWVLIPVPVKCATLEIASLTNLCFSSMINPSSTAWIYHNDLEVLYLDKKSMSVPEMRRLLGLGKTDSYWLIKKGYFKTIMLFGKMRVMVDSFEEWYANQFHYKKVDGTPPGQNWRHTMSIRETADILGIAPTTVYSLIDKELFIVLTVSGKKRIDKKSFEEWYANQSKYHRHDKEVIADV